MWCGARPGDDEYMCSWIEAPGYGNAWEQIFTTQTLWLTNPVNFSYKIRYDTEHPYDSVLVEYANAYYGWDELASYDGTGEAAGEHEFYFNGVATKIRFHFYSDGAWSDQDGLYNTDGAVIVDSLTITDNDGFYDYEDFESADVGDKDIGYWRTEVPWPFGTYSGLMTNLVAPDIDPCNYNLSTQMVFFVGSPFPDLVYPGLYSTPFCKGPNGNTEPCQDESVISPVIDLTRYSSSGNHVQDTDIPSGELSDLGGAILKFTAYQDLPFMNLVFYEWQVRSIVDGCAGEWKDYNYIYGYEEKGYVIKTNEISQFIESDSIQVSFRVFDMCAQWHWLYNVVCTAHTPAPWFDNVYVRRYKTVGPQWSYRDLDLFQDNFPEVEFDLESFVRADAANDLNANDDPVIRPGDSIVVSCYSPLGGSIAEDGGGARVYMHVKCTYIGDPGAPKPPLAGAVLEGNYGHYVSDDGTWTIIQGDSARTSSGNIAPDRFAFDLNDSLLTRGYMVEYYFKAYDNDGDSSTLPRYAHALPEDNPFPGGSYFFEFTCLPTLRTDILYVDDFHGRGTKDGVVQHYFDDTFRYLFGSSSSFPDRYDVNNPSSLVSNGPGSRAKPFQLTTAYDVIIWDSGNLYDGTITDGTEYSDKSNDCQMLNDWLMLSDHDVGLWVLGDNVASDLTGSPSPSALELMVTWCGVNPVASSYFEVAGGQIGTGVVNPFITTVPGTYLPNPMHTDSLYAYGGCPLINDFDCLETAGGSGQFALQYPDYGGESYYAAIQNQQVNAAEYAARTIWFGFSYMYITDIEIPSWSLVRYRLTYDILSWFGMPLFMEDLTDEPEMPLVNSLSQNFPNPFNPVTTIQYSVKDRGVASLRVYNAAGQLVRTLVNEVKDPGVYKVDWDGRNNRGLQVTSGVYFYCMEAKDYRSTRKMVMLR
jgi:hypothetical protein